jgi:hypothetical protein
MANEYYWNSAKWEINQNGEGTMVHPLVALAIAPMIGGLFVIFMPFIGLYLFAKFLASKMAGLVHSLFHTTVAPIAEPGSAYITGSKSEGSKAAESALEELSKEIQARRNE